MILSPDKLSMPRYAEGSSTGKITADIYTGLKKEEKDALRELAAQLDTETKVPILRGIEVAHRRKNRREDEIRVTDIINELVVHETSKAVKRAATGARVNIDEDLIKSCIKKMIPEGIEEGKRFYETIQDFKKALAEGNYALINAIYSDPERYEGRGLKGMLESFDRDKRPRMNAALGLYLRAIIERRIADLLESGDPADVDTFVALFDGVDFIEELKQENIPIDPRRITSNPDLERAVLNQLNVQNTGGLRPKVVEATQLGLVAPGNIPNDIAAAAALHAAQRKAPFRESSGKTYEQSAHVLAGGGVYGSYRDVSTEVGVRSAEELKLLAVLDDTPKDKPRLPKETERQWRDRNANQYRLTDRLVNISSFDTLVQTEVLQVTSALTGADKAALKVEKEELEKAKISLRQAVSGTPDFAARTRAVNLRQRAIDVIYQKYARMTSSEFKSFLEVSVKPILLNYLADSLKESIESFVKMRKTLKELRTFTSISYQYRLLTDADIDASSFRDGPLKDAVADRLGKAAGVPDGGVSYTLEKQRLIDNGVVIDNAEFTRWGL